MLTQRTSRTPRTFALILLPTTVRSFAFRSLLRKPCHWIYLRRYRKILGLLVSFKFIELLVSSTFMFRFRSPFMSDFTTDRGNTGNRPKWINTGNKTSNTTRTDLSKECNRCPYETLKSAAPVPIVSAQTDEIKAERFIFSFLIHAVECQVKKQNLYAEHNCGDGRG